MKEQGQVPGRTVSKFDPVAAKKRCEAATKGPWLRQKQHDNAAPRGVIDAYDEEAEGYYTIATVHEPGDADEDFITHAREDLPAALEALEAIQRAVDETSDTENGLWATVEVIRGILRDTKEGE